MICPEDALVNQIVLTSPIASWTHFQFREQVTHGHFFNVRLGKILLSRWALSYRVCIAALLRESRFRTNSEPYPFGVTATDIEPVPIVPAKYSSVHSFGVALVLNPCMMTGRATRTSLENPRAVGGRSNVSRNLPFKSGMHGNLEFTSSD